MSIGADGAEYCVKYWRIGAGVSIEYRFHTNPAQVPPGRRRGNTGAAPPLACASPAACSARSARLHNRFTPLASASQCWAARGAVGPPSAEELTARPSPLRRRRPRYCLRTPLGGRGVVRALPGDEPRRACPTARIGRGAWRRGYEALCVARLDRRPTRSHASGPRRRGGRARAGPRDASLAALAGPRRAAQEPAARPQLGAVGRRGAQPLLPVRGECRSLPAQICILGYRADHRFAAMQRFRCTLTRR